METANDREPIAIIGMACRFPDANTPAAFWRQLRAGLETVTVFTDEELDATGVPSQMYGRPDYIRKRGIIAGYDRFDAEFFGYSDEEAAFLDPQQRLLMSVAYEAMEDAGQFREVKDPSLVTGVFTSVRTSTYTSYALGPVLAPHGTNRSLQAVLGNAVDQACMRIAWNLGLTGPCVSVQTACSSSLVTIHQACETLQSGECDMAIVGASALFVPQNHGYLYEASALLSKDGHCHAFDMQANGVVPGSGVGVVVLKRLADARARHDRIYALVLGTAVNNSGPARTNYRSPSVVGQSAVIAEAIDMAGIDPHSISYVEANGTGTFIGDSIEVESLTRGFGCTSIDEKPFCGLGSVKTNIGHLTQAAGMAGLIKTVLALQHRELPPSLFYQTPNPQLQGSPFYVVDNLRPWPASPEHPRRAGVNAFAIGGTNAHVVLEEAPPEDDDVPDDAAGSWLVLTLSAKSAEALSAFKARYLAFLEEEPDTKLVDMCWTSTVCRPHYAHRLAAVANERVTLAEALARAEPAAGSEETGRESCLLFTEQTIRGDYRQVLELHPAFARVCFACAPDFLRLTGQRLDDALAGVNVAAGVEAALTYTVQRALAALWMSWGMQPQTVGGCGVGFYTAACLAAGLKPEAGLRLLLDDRTTLASDGKDARSAGIRLLDMNGRAMNTRPEDARSWLDGQRLPGVDLPCCDAQGRALCFVEIGADSDCFSNWKTVAKVQRCTWVNATQDSCNPEEGLVRALAVWYLIGAEVNWPAFAVKRPGRCISLPHYPFAQKKIWFGAWHPDHPAFAGKKQES